MEEEKESIELNVCTYNVVCEVEVAQGINVTLQRSANSPPLALSVGVNFALMIPIFYLPSFYSSFGN